MHGGASVLCEAGEGFLPTRSAAGNGGAGDDIATACIIILARTAGL